MLLRKCNISGIIENVCHSEHDDDDDDQDGTWNLVKKLSPHKICLTEERRDGKKHWVCAEYGLVC